MFFREIKWNGRWKHTADKGQAIRRKDSRFDYENDCRSGVEPGGMIRRSDLGPEQISVLRAGRRISERNPTLGWGVCVETCRDGITPSKKVRVHVLH